MLTPEVFYNQPLEMASRLSLERNSKNFHFGNLRNLRILIEPSGIYYVRGSLWKYAHGDNCGVFTMKQFEKVVEEINNLTYGTFQNSDLIAFEFGVTMELDHDPP